MKRKSNITLWLISAVVPGMLAGVGYTKTSHLVWATGRTNAVLKFLSQNPLAHDIENPTLAKTEPQTQTTYRREVHPVS